MRAALGSDTRLNSAIKLAKRAAYLTAIYKDPTKPENLRMDAAKAAIRYERAAFGPQEHVPKTDSIPLAERLKLLARK